MKSFLEEDKEVRYFPNDSEMPILIHYLQVYFSHPERSIQRSQVVQSVVSILSTKNKHWNHRTVRLWFNNNKRVFFRPTSPITQSSNPKENNLQQRTEPSTQVKTPLYIPARPLSVVQLSSAINRSPIPPAPVITKTPPMAPPPPPPPQQQQMQHIQQMQKMTAMNMKPSIQMNSNLNPMNQQSQPQQFQMRLNQTYQRSPYLIQQPPPPPPNTISQQPPPPPPPSPQPNLFMMAKPGSFALTLNSEVEAITTTMLNNPQNLPQVLSNIETDITDKISQLHEQRWVQLVTVQPSKTSIIDNKAVEQINNEICNTTSNNETIENATNSIEKNGFQLQEISNFDMIDCALVTSNTGDPAVISWDCETQCQRFHFKDRICSLCNESATHFTSSNAKAIAYSENNDTFWVNSGNFLRPFSAADLSEGPSIKASLKYSERSAMTFWNENLVLASGSSIMSWSPKNLDDVLRGGKGETENEAEDESDESEPKTSYTLMIPSITSLTTVGENLVVASTEHHTAQVYATNGALVAKCIGHTSGITCLHSFDTNSFITGSADQTAKYWDIRVHVPVFNLLRHRGIVTGVYGCGNTNPNLVITGGTDGVIRGWDIRQLRHLFAFSVGLGSPIAIGVKQDEPILSIVTSERPNELFFDLEKYGPKLSPKMKFLEAPPNAVLTYSMPV